MTLSTDDVERFWSKVDNTQARLTSADVLRIRALVAAGVKSSAVAAEYGVKRNTINVIVSRRVWRHVV